MSNDDQEEHGEGENGSVWTSYSDLFMAIAVVFLIMFVFSILAAGLQKARVVNERKAEQKYQMGKVPENIKNQNKRDIDELVQSMRTIESKKKILAENVKEIQRLSEVLTDKQEAALRLRQDHLKKVRMLQEANLKIEVRNDRIEALNRDLSVVEARLSEAEEVVFKSKEDYRQATEEIRTLTNQKLSQVTELDRKSQRIAEITKKQMEQQERSEKDAIELSKLHQLKIENEESIRKQQDNILRLEQSVQTLMSDGEQRKKMLKKITQDSEQRAIEIAKLKQELEISHKKMNEVTQESQKIKNEKSLIEEKLFSQIEQMKIEHTNQLDEQRQKHQAQINSAKQAYEEETASLQSSHRQELENRDRSHKNVLAGISRENSEAMKKNAQEKINFEEKIAKLQAESSHLHSELKESNQSNAQLKNQSQQDINENKRLADQIEKLSKELGAAKAQNKKQFQSLAKTSKEIGDLQNKQEQLASQLQIQKKQCAEADEKNKDLDRLAEKQQSALQHFQDELANQGQKVKKLQTQIGNRSAQLAKVKGALADTQDKLHTIKNERKQIAAKIADRLHESGIDVLLDAATGIITMRLDDVFSFTNASYAISQEAKERIRKIIPIYASSLFDDPQTRDRIAAVTVTGFASPRYRKKYIDPLAVDLEAYNYNMELSMNRARQITHFIFGDEVGNYPHKTYLRSITEVAGKGYSQPLLKTTETSPESTDESCGKYDCSRSRRVEINFQLKERFFRNPDQPVVESKFKKINESIEPKDRFNKSENGVKEIAH